MNPDAFCDGYHEMCTEVRYAETDQMGYAHHSVAVTWFELGRVGWMRDVGSAYSSLEARGFLMPVVRLNLRYHAPAKFEDEVIIQTRLTQMGRATVTFENRVLRQDVTEGKGTARTVLVEGQVELACIDPQGRIHRFPKDLVDQFSCFLYAGESGTGQTRSGDV